MLVDVHCDAGGLNLRKPSQPRWQIWWNTYHRRRLFDTPLVNHSHKYVVPAASSTFPQ